MEVVVGISGASGMIYALGLLRSLKDKEVKTHVIISKPAEIIIQHELELGKDSLLEYAAKCYTIDDLAAPIASGSHGFDAMVVIPCSMSSLAAIAHGYCNNLLLRVADVTIKEGRKLILVPREAPLHSIHLENMLKLSRIGVCIIPACPGFYHRPQRIEDLADFVVGKVLEQLGIKHELYESWKGL